MTCTLAEGSFALPDPLRNLAGAAEARACRADGLRRHGNGTVIPANCPGGSPGTK